MLSPEKGRKFLSEHKPGVYFTAIFLHQTSEPLFQGQWLFLCPSPFPFLCVEKWLSALKADRQNSLIWPNWQKTNLWTRAALRHASLEQTLKKQAKEPRSLESHTVVAAPGLWMLGHYSLFTMKCLYPGGRHRTEETNTDKSLSRWPHLGLDSFWLNDPELKAEWSS